MNYGKENNDAANQKGKFLAMVICWFLGNGVLLAWNSMLTVEDYYVSLFSKYHPTRVLTLTYQPFAFVTTAIFAYHEAKANTRLRNLSGFALFCVSTLCLVVLDLATSGRGGLGPFIGVCILSATFGFANGLLQGGIVGDLSLMCPEFLQSFFGGLAASGAITSVLRLITKAAFDKSKNGLRKGALMFFAITTFFELLCTIIYAFVFPKLPIVRYYRAKAAAEGSLTVAADLAAAGLQISSTPQADENPNAIEESPKAIERLSNKQLMLKNLDYVFDLFLIYLLTLSIIPGFLSEDTGSHALGGWYALVLIAMFNTLDLVGRYLPLINCLKLTSRKGLLVAILSRFLLIPAFYFAAKYGGQGWMIMLTSFLGLSNGYLTVCVITEAPKGYKGPEQNALGNILTLFLSAGVFAGVVCDWLWLIGKGW